MGLKRSFDEGELQGLPFKHAKQLQSVELLTSPVEINSPDGGSEKGEPSGKRSYSFCLSFLHLSFVFFFTYPHLLESAL